MQGTTEVGLGGIAAIATLVAALWALNYPRARRHRQGWSPVLALLFAVAAVVVFTLQYARYVALVAPLLDLLSGLAPPALWRAPAAMALVLNVTLLSAFVAVKAGGRGVGWLLEALRKKAEGGRSPFHAVDPERGGRLRPAWVYPGLAFRLMGFVAVVLLLASFGVALYTSVELQATLLLGPSLLVLLELGWFLDGAWSGAEERFHGEDVTASKGGAYGDLYEEYLALWPRRWLAASASPALPAPRPVPLFGERSGEEDPRWAGLLGQGVPLTSTHRYLLEGMRAGEDRLVSGGTYADLRPVLALGLEAALWEGHRVVVLVEPDRRASPARLQHVADWVRAGLADVLDGAEVWAVGTVRDLASGESPDVLVGSVGDFLDEGLLDREPAWFRRVKTVLALHSTNTVLERPSATRSFIEALASRAPGLQVVAVADARFGGEAGMRSVLAGANFEEHELQSSMPPDVHAVVWRHEGRSDFHLEATARVVSGAQQELGVEPVLALPALRAGAEPVLVLGQEDEPWDEYVEEVAKAAPIVAESIERGELDEQPVSWLARPRERAVVLVRDRQAHLVGALREALPLARTAVLVHVISPPYLLRDYFAANLDFFLHEHRLAHALAPALREASPTSTAHVLLERLMIAHAGGEEEVGRGLSEEVVLQAVRAGDPDARVVEDALDRLFRTAFGFEGTAEVLESEVRTEFDEGEGAFVERTYFWLDPHVRERPELRWLCRYELRDDAGHVLGHVAYDHLYQTYLPRQIHAFRSELDGAFADKPYEIVGVDDQQRIVRAEKASSRRSATYRPHLQAELSEPVWEAEEARTLRGSTSVRVDLGHARLTVATPGYFAFHGAIDRRPEEFTYHELAEGEVPVRDYPRARVARLRIGWTPDHPETGQQGPEGQQEGEASGAEVAVEADVATTLAVLLREAFVTLLPETHPLLLVGVPTDRFVEGPPSGAEEAPLLHVLPEFRLAEAPEEEPGVPEHDNWIDLYFVEDSHADLGLVRAVGDAEWRDTLLDYVRDYLTWLGASLPNKGEAANEYGGVGTVRGEEEEESKAEAEDGSEKEQEALFSVVRAGWRVRVEDRGSFLRYGREALPPGIDLGRVRRLLRDLGGTPKLTKAREKHDRLEASAVRSARVCDFCGRPLEVVRETLSDGRERCGECERTAVDTLERLRKVYAEGWAFLVEDLGQDLTRDINVHFASAHEIAAARGTTFMPTGAMDPRAIGLAVWRGDEFAIMVEKGSPYALTLALVVHELTHIWQYTHLDYNRMYAESGLVLIEGHTMWAELECLMRKELAPDFVEQEKQRTDVYGVGYRRVVHELARDGSVETPFEWLERRYPKPDSAN